jgi:hypothetical protein
MTSYLEVLQEAKAHQIDKRKILEHGLDANFAEQSKKAGVPYSAWNVGQLPELYPAIGKLTISWDLAFTANKVFLGETEYAVMFQPDVVSANTYSKVTPEQRKKMFQQIKKAMTQIASKYKTAGFRTKVKADNESSSSYDYQLIIWCPLPAPAHTMSPAAAKPSTTGTWGIKVTSGDGRRSHVFTSTQDIAGPFRSSDAAQSAIWSLKDQLAYDDDFKYPVFKVVKL